MDHQEDTTAADASLAVEDLGRMTYEDAHARQLATLDARLRGDVADTLLLVEHPPVITLGRGTHPDNVLGAGDVPVVTCERGGDVTLHAPGQVVGYLIRLLPEGRRDLKAHLRLVEEIQIAALARFGLRGQRVPGKTGVWVGTHKIASIGVACRRWCTWHGFALNVTTDLTLFQRINPCGFDAGVMTTMENESERAPSLAEVKAALGLEARRLLAGAH